MDKTELKKIAYEVVRIINESKATFFVNDKNVSIDPKIDDFLYELKAEISTNVEMYFYELLK